MPLVWWESVSCVVKCACWSPARTLAHQSALPACHVAMVLGVQVAQAAHLAASGGSTSPGGPGAGAGGGGGGGAGSWASRRNGSSMARHGSHGSRSDGPALEGTGLGVHGGRYVHAWQCRAVAQDCTVVEDRGPRGGPCW